MQTELDRWFVHEILVHEEALMRFLHRHWPHRDELHDLRQELYARIYEAGAKSRPIRPPASITPGPSGCGSTASWCSGRPAVAASQAASSR